MLNAWRDDPPNVFRFSLKLEYIENRAVRRSLDFEDDTDNSILWYLRVVPIGHSAMFYLCRNSFPEYYEFIYEFTIVSGDGEMINGFDRRAMIEPTQLCEDYLDPTIPIPVNMARSWFLVQIKIVHLTPAEFSTNQNDPKLVGKRYGIYNVKNGALADEATEEEITEYKNVCDSAAEPDEIEQAENEGRADQTKLVRDKIQLKQAKKALTLIQIEPATPRLLSELFYSRNVESVGFLRSDHIAYMIQMSGIVPGSRILIFDQCSGVMTAHVMERLNGQGHCVVLHIGTNGDNVIPCVNNCQFSKQVQSTLRKVPVQRLLTIPNGDQMEEVENKEMNGDAKKHAKEPDPKQRQLEDEALEWFKTDGLDGFGRYDALFVISKNADVCSVLDKTLNAVRPSGSVIVYSANAPVISAARIYLTKQTCVFLQVRSFQQREIQVLKHRTHPLMQQLIAGGYILTGIRCQDP